MDASRRHTELLRRVIVSSSTMTSALEIPKLLGVLKQNALRDHLTGVSGVRALLEELSAAKPDLPTMGFDSVAEGLAEQTAVNAEMVVAAAVVVLSHSTADDVFTGACELAVELDPAKWASELNMERPVTLKTLIEKGKDGVIAAELVRFKKQLPAKSLPTRAELLFRHVAIRHNEEMFGAEAPERFRLSVLKEADDLRNSIVHSSGLLPRVDLERSDKTMRFLHEAAATALRSLAWSYGLQIDMTVFTQPGQATQK